MKPLAALSTLAAVLLLALLPACKTVNTVEPAAGPEPAPIADKRITTDSSLTNAAYPVNVYEDQTATGLRRIAIELYNKTSKVQRVQYQFEWFDDAGFPVSSPLSTWTDLTLAGKERKRFMTIAPTTKATDFRLKLIEKIQR